MPLSLLKVEIRFEHDVVLARRRARQIAHHLGFGRQDQIRIATAVSELARNVFQYTKGGRVEFSVEQHPHDRFRINVTDNGPGIADIDLILSGGYRSKTGMGLGILGAKRLADDFTITSDSAGTRVVLWKTVPASMAELTPGRLGEIVQALTREEPQNPFEEMQGHNQELLAALDQVQRHESRLMQLNLELEAALAAAEKASNAKTEFLANMSHEVRTPLNAIVGLAALLARTELSAQQKKYVSVLGQSATSMTGLVTDLLDISKIEDNKIVLEAIPFDLPEVIERVVEIAGVAIDKNAVRLGFTSSLDAGVRYVGDPQRIHQVLLNLVSNAVKFTAQGCVTVEVAEVSRVDLVSHLQITVTDTGIGMSQEATAKIFDKFVQADSSTTRRFGGSGLGLSIARSLAELMGGRLSVTSVVGTGSVFTLALPLAHAGTEIARDSPERPHVKRDRTNVRVLVVDDNDANLLVATALLEDLGYHVHVASSGLQALELLKHHPVDIVLMDIQMEGMDGLETTRRVRAWEARENQPPRSIIAMTAHGDAGNKAMCLTAGMTDYLSKPIDPNIFDDVLKRYSR